jgi:hypothetical protein
MLRAMSYPNRLWPLNRDGSFRSLRTQSEGVQSCIQSQRTEV